MHRFAIRTPQSRPTTSHKKHRLLNLMSKEQNYSTRTIQGHFCDSCTYLQAFVGYG